MNETILQNAVESGMADVLYHVEFPELPDSVCLHFQGDYFLIDLEYKKAITREVSAGAMTDFILLNRGYKIR